MSDWFIKTILYPSKHISLVVLLDYLKRLALLAQDQHDKMPIVEIVLDNVSYLLVRESDFRERFGE